MEENNKKKEVILRKIALQKFIETLVDVYNSGADYVDITIRFQPNNYIAE